MRRARLIRRAGAHFRADQPLPLDLFAALNEAGIDVSELERTSRNGAQLTHHFDVV